MTCSGNTEPKRSEHSSTDGPQALTQRTFHRCACGHIEGAHQRVGDSLCLRCGCQQYRCDHTRCGWRPREEKPKPCTCGPDEACGDPCDYEPRCTCAPNECVCDSPEEPPLTPEEEEQAPSDGGSVHNHAFGDAPEGNCPACSAPAEPPPLQPERRPPYAVAYSVGGHLYEVAVSGDATVRAVDGALIITHHLGPVAGIVQAAPILSEES